MRARNAAVLLVAVLTLASAAPVRASSQFLRRPDIHGDQIVFTSEGDLWLASVTTGVAQRITSDDGVESAAYFSPDGRSIAFTGQYDGGTDAYVMDLDGGPPKRLTWWAGPMRTQGWTPDGKQVLFRGQKGFPRDFRLWAVPATGGQAIALAVPYAEFASMNRDGHRLAYVPVSAEWQHWKRYQGGEADDIWLTDLSAHTFQRLTTDPAIDTEPVWVGDQVYFVSERDGHANLWMIPSQGGAATQVTHYADYDVRYPSSDGARVVYEHGDGLGLYDPATGKTTELAVQLHSDRVHARPKRVQAATQLASVVLGPTGKRMLVSARGQILNAPAENGDVRVVAAQSGARCQYPAWSPDAQRCAYVSDASGEEQVWIAPANGGEAKKLTSDHQGPLGPIQWAPDGKTLVTSDREMRVLLVDATTGAITVVDQADRSGSYDYVNDSPQYSPDGRWLTYVKAGANWNYSVWLYDIAKGTRTRISSPEMQASAPVFDAEGKFIAFLADRAFDPKTVNANRYFTFDKFTRVTLVTLAADTKSPFLEKNDEELPGEAKPGKDGDDKKDAKKVGTPLPVTKVDLAGITERLIDVPVDADHYVRVLPVEGRLLLQVSNGESSELRAFDLKKLEVSTIAKKITDVQVSADRKKILVQDGHTFRVLDASADGLGDKTVPTDAWVLDVDPAAEWKQLFHETWRIARDFFYDPAMHGADWPAVRKKYEAMLPAVADRSDLLFLQGEVIAELNCGHAYVRGGDLVTAPVLPMGFLGVDVEFVPGASPAYQLTRLLPGDGFEFDARSPLLAPGVGVKPGDYLLAVNGRPVRADQDLQALLVGTAGKVTSLTINSKASFTGAREVRIKPLPSEAKLRYFDWVAAKTEYVRKNGGENIGYLHIPSMSEPGLVEFGKHYYPNLQKDAFVYDVRENGGGYIDAMLLLQMSSKPYSWFKPRFGASWTRQDWAFAGHAATLCNENSGSDAEEFSDAFQRLKMGPVIGVPTWGGEVGSGGGYPLMDGGALYIPNYGEWVADGHWVIEGTGVKPDMMVPDDPAAVLAGRDPQLDRAIEYLKAKLKSDPVVMPTPPPFPVKTKH